MASSDGPSLAGYGYSNGFFSISVARVTGGYLGQVTVADEIAWESETYWQTAEQAREDAQLHAIKKLRKVFK